MKKAIKTIWSVWDKTDRIAAIGSIIVSIVMFCFICSGCAAQNSSIDSIKTMDYGYDIDESIDDYIPIYADGVIDFIYCTQDGEYIIEYIDDDYFDRDNLPQNINCVNSDSNYVQIYCSEELFFKYLEWYSQLCNKMDEFFAASDTFAIKEQYIIDSEIYYYKLIRIK